VVRPDGDGFAPSNLPKLRATFQRFNSPQRHRGLGEVEDLGLPFGSALNP
jgi:hypothetical protein